MRKVFLAALLLLVTLFFLPRFLVRLSLLLGNFFQQSEEVVEEKNFLFPPLIEPLPEATNSATLTIRGFSQGGEKVEIFINEISKEKVLVGNDGAFYVDELRLFEGENRLKAIAFDKKGNKSPFSKELVVVYKKKGPQLEIEQPEEGEVFSSKEKKIKIIGKTDPGSSLRINERWVVVKNNGSFNYEAELNEGENLFKIVALDSAGNETIVERRMSYSQE